MQKFEQKFHDCGQEIGISHGLFVIRFPSIHILMDVLSKFLFCDCCYMSLFDMEDRSFVLKTRELEYSIPTSRRTICKPCSKSTDDVKKILRPMQLRFQSGEISGILGPSGCGKSTLLNILMQYIKPTAGYILLNDAPFNPNTYKRSIGFVSQNDILMSSCTVRETINFSAQMRLPKDMPTEEKSRRVDAILKQLNLERVQNHVLGDIEKRGISGGEKRRVSIGVELVQEPRILCLDEPTTGLDSSTSYTIIKALKNYAKSHSAIVLCTIHQPKSHTFDLFDKVIFLSEGRLIYHGPTYSIQDYFSIQFHLTFPEDQNPHEYVMDQMIESEVSMKQMAKAFKRYQNIQEAYSSRETSPLNRSKSILTHVNETTRVDESGNFNETPRVDESGNFKVYPCNGMPRIPSTFHQFKHITIRYTYDYLRNPLNLKSQVVEAIFISLFFGLLYLQIGKNPYAIQDIGNALFVCLLVGTFIPALTAVFLFPTQKRVIQKERNLGFYTTFPFYLALHATGIPVQAVLCLLQSLVTYYMMGFRNASEAFMIFFVAIFLTLFILEGIALMCSYVSPSEDVANMIMGIACLILVSFGGFLTNKMPNFLIMFYYISPFTYALRILYYNELSGRVFRCQNIQVECPTGCSSSQPCYAPCSYQTGDDYIKAMNLGEEKMWLDVVILISMAIILRIALYILVKFKKS